MIVYPYTGYRVLWNDAEQVVPDLAVHVDHRLWWVGASDWPGDCRGHVSQVR